MSKPAEVHDEDEKYWYQSKLPNRDLFDDTGGLEDLIDATKELEFLNKTRLDLIDEDKTALDVQSPRFQAATESADFAIGQGSTGGLDSGSIRSARYNYSKRAAAREPSVQSAQAFDEHPLSASLDVQKTPVFPADSAKTSIDLQDAKPVESTLLPASFYNPSEFDQDNLDYKQMVVDLMLNRPTDLTLAKTRHQKEMLLKAAIQMGDGNAIYPILIHLRTTTSDEKFYKLLKGTSWLRGREAQIACDHYIHYVRTFEDAQVLSRELQNLGLFELAIKFHMDDFNRQFRRGMERLTSSGSTRAEDVVSYIGNWYKSLLSFLGTLRDVQYGKLISQQMLFLDVKKRLFHDLGSAKATNSYFKQLAETSSPLDILKFTIKNPKFTMERVGERFNLSDQQCAYALLQGFAEEQKWTELSQSAILHGLGRRLANGTNIPWDVIADVASNAPKELLTSYLQQIGDPELKFEAADRHQCYELAVDTLANELRDRGRLDTYRNTVPRESPAYMKAIHYLSNMQTSNDSTGAALTTSGAFSSAMQAGAEMASGLNAVWKKERSRIRDFFHRKQ